MGEQRPVRVIADSTSDIPPAMAAELGIKVVPLTVSFGSESFADGVDITMEEFLKRLQSESTLPTTSQPAVTQFEAEFRAAIDSGEDVVCVTLSSELSGTFNSARLASLEVDPDRIVVVDSRGTTMQTGWVVIAAARVAQAGGSHAEVAAEATDAVGRSSLFALLRTLDYVYKGGRIGRAQHMFGSALSIKPIIGFVDGIVEPIERVRTWKKALVRIVELLAPTPSDIMVLHTDNLIDAEYIAAALRQKYPKANLGIGTAGAVMSTYAGPGCIAATALYPRQE